MKKNRNLFWVPLDNAAKIFPAIRSEENTTVFRLMAVLKERVAIQCLIEAVKLATLRFPYYRVSLFKGFFWYYLEESVRPITIQADKGMICGAFNKNKDNGLLVRVLALENTISVEFSHIITDGYGAVRFLEWLLEKYVQLKTEQKIDIIDLTANPDILLDEMEDSYSNNFKENIPYVSKISKAYHLPFPLRAKPRFEVMAALLDLNEIKKLASAKEVSITEYLLAVYLYVLQDIIFDSTRKLPKNRILRVQVPVNLRKIYPSKTMRNFSLFVMPDIDTRLGPYTFDELLKTVFYKMKIETDEKLLSKIVARNVGSEKKLLVRGIPLFIKSIVLYYKYYSQGTNQYSGAISNLGKIQLKQNVDTIVDYFIVTPPPPNKKLKINIGVIGYNNKLALSFGNITLSKEFERRFIRFLVKEGLQIKLINL